MSAKPPLVSQRRFLIGSFLAGGFLAHEPLINTLHKLKSGLVRALARDFATGARG